MKQTLSYRIVSANLSMVLGLQVVALLAGWLLLGPGSNLVLPAAERAAWVAGHPLLWSLGWWAWLAGAVASAALPITAGVHLHSHAGTGRLARQARAWAVAAVALGLLALLPDILGGWLARTGLVDAARGTAQDFLAVERRVATLTDTRAGPAWLAMTWCLGMAVATWQGGWLRHRALVGWTLLTVLLFLVSEHAEAMAIGALGQDGATLAPVCVRCWKLLAFLSWLCWIGGIAALVGRDHHGRHPAQDAAGQRLSWPLAGAAEHLAFLLHEPGLRDLLRPLVPRRLGLRSDLSDVVLVSWLVPEERLARLVPPPLRPARLGGDRALLTLLAFRHGHIGPERLGRLRLRLPSPRACVVRIPVGSGAAGAPPDGAWLLRVALDSPLHVAAARLLTDGLPAHMPALLEHRQDGDGWWTCVEPGASRAPDVRLRVVDTASSRVPEGFGALFSEWDDLVFRMADVVRMLRVDPAVDSVFETGVRWSFRPADAVPVRVETFESALLEPLVEGCPRVAFVLPRVLVRILGEGRVRAGRG